MTGSYYDFPRLEKFLGSDTERERQSNCHVKRTVRSAGFRSLVTLRLGFVNEHFLGNCPFLELLQVTRSSSIRNLRVVGPLLKLKWLEISQCTLLKRLEISATNLVSLTYKGPLAYKLGTSTKVILENVLALSELCTDGAYCASVVLKPTPHLIHLRQLGSLKLVLPEEVSMSSALHLRSLCLCFPELLTMIFTVVCCDFWSVC